MGELLEHKDIFDEFASKIHDFLEIKEAVEINDLLQLGDDISKGFNLLRTSYNLISQKKFEVFLKNIGSSEEPLREQISKLMNYVDDKEKAEFISNMFSKILLSKSIKACAIMGYIMNDVLNNKENVKHEVLILIEALSNFFDVDIENFKTIKQYVNKNKTKYFYCNHKFTNSIKNEGKDIKSIILTLEKSVVHQLIYKEIDIEADVQNEDYVFNSVDSSESYSINAVGELLNEYILKLQL